ncbi:MAG TPA: hypothetical protein VNH84_00700 [Candidatus Saccharimonadales bacterium]|nr:hypothetical protein [Candidatus Saccharimonadales bacterium]
MNASTAIVLAILYSTLLFVIALLDNRVRKLEDRIKELEGAQCGVGRDGD